MQTNAGGNHNFAQIPGAHIPRSSFNRSHSVKTTMDAGKLYPFFADEIIPGDTVNITPHIFARMTTPIYPVMDNIYLETFFFFVPNRLIWSNFKRFMGEQLNPADTTTFITPVVTSPTDGFARLGVMDYLGVPPKATTGTTHSVSALWARAYNLIWNEWFRDENLNDPVTVHTGDGPDAETDYTLLYRGKRKDYFTSCLPWPQKWTAQSLPLGTSAPVTITGSGAPTFWNTAPSTDVFGPLVGGTGDPAAVTINYDASAGVSGSLEWKDTALTGTANLTGATAATINDLRLAFMLQAMSEKDARAGSRYVEIVQSHFGIANAGGDARFQRPEYLGGDSINIQMMPVPTTFDSETSSRTVGNLGAYATGVGIGDNITRSFSEHGVIIGLVNIRADMHYQQGTPRMFNRSTKYEYYWPGLAMLGEQAVLGREIFTKGDSGDTTVFGYQERWAEMRMKNGLITGKLRSDDSLTLDSWHLAQQFTSRPALNAEFIKENPPFTRVVAAVTEPHFIMDGYIEFTHVRPMPVFSVPFNFSGF